MLGKYRIVRHIGAGGMGAVYEAVHVEIGKPVALKVLGEKLAADSLAQARFLREAEAASRLQHRHVVSVSDYGSEDGVAFLVMELLRGKDLGAHLQRFPHRLSVDKSVDIVLAVCAGVSAAHQARVVHRDLKPRNIFLARTQLREVEIKVLDFGISKMEDVGGAISLTETGEILGTTHYLSPEQVAGRPADARTDQYALGVVLYECLTGRLPHEGDSSFVVMRSIREGKFLPPSALLRQVPAGCEAAILRAMSRDPVERFENVHGFGRALLPFASPKKQMAWADYYRGAPCETSATGDLESLPLSERPGVMRGNRASSHPPARSKQPAESRPSLASHVPTARLQVLIGRSSRVWPIAVLLAVIGTAAFLLVSVSARPGATVQPRIPVAPRPPAAFRPPMPARGPTVAIPAPIEDVTLDVADAPPGLVVSVDGQDVQLPLKWAKDGQVRRLTFRAPGFETRTLDVPAREDATLRLNMRSLRLEPTRRPLPAPQQDESPDRDPRPARPASQPPPLMDI
jgi:serine/threonine-protein kinase